MAESADTSLIETLRRRLKARLIVALSLARAHRFLLELEPLVSEGPDPFALASLALRDWRQALRNEEIEKALDGVERTWALLEVCRQRVIARDAPIEAFRVRWACENAPLTPQTIDSLARLYRLLPYSTSSQSKYEYVLTRRLAGPIGPERKVASTEELEGGVAALEEAWGASRVNIDDDVVAVIERTLASFKEEAAAKEDAAGFTSSALLRRFGAFKASIGDQLFDVRVSVAVVEANVAILNVLNQLLADAGGQPLRGSARASGMRSLLGAKPPSMPSTVPVSAMSEADVRTTGPSSEGLSPEGPSPEAPSSESQGPVSLSPEGQSPEGPSPEVERQESLSSEGPSPEDAKPKSPGPEGPGSEGLSPADPSPEPRSEEESPAPVSTAGLPVAEAPSQGKTPRRREALHTGEVDLSGLDIIRSLRRRFLGGEEASEVDPSLPTALREEGPEAPSSPVESETLSETGGARQEARIGEADSSGLDFVHRLGDQTDQPPGGREVSDDEEEFDSDESDDGVRLSEAPVQKEAAPAGSGGGLEALVTHAEQLPSARAYELGKLEENAAIVERYLAWPRSAEVWQLDLDYFLSPASGAGVKWEGNAVERRRALDLILASDDLICLRATQEGPPNPEHRAQVRTVANAMALLRTQLRRSAVLAQGDALEVDPLLYVADHLLWERLRLEVSLKRKPSRQGPPQLPRSASVDADSPVDRARRLRRHRRILVRVVAAGAALTSLAGLISFSLPQEKVDPEVTLVQVAGLPGADLFDEARAFKATLFVTVSRTWSLLGAEEKRSIVRGLGAFAVERGLFTVSVVGPKGETWATFKDDEVLLDGELTPADLARR